MMLPRQSLVVSPSPVPLVLRLMLGFLLGLVSAADLSAGAAELPNPYPRAVFVGEQLLRWDFAADTEGWRAANQCELAAGDGL